jgi:hypothetical protein
MKLSIPLAGLLGAAVAIEVIIWMVCASMYSDLPETFRHAARYSGRASFVAYWLCFAYTITQMKHPQSQYAAPLSRLLTAFALMHLIHFGFLAGNIYLNHIELIPYKLAGGFLAYMLIIFFPLLLFAGRAPRYLTPIYFVYVGIVMAVTFIARLKGEFAGAPASNFHYIGIALVVLTYLVYAVRVYQTRSTRI